MPNGDFESIYQESLSLLDSILQDISLHISVLLCKIVKRLKLYSFVHQSKSFSISVLAILRYPAGNPKDKEFVSYRGQARDEKRTAGQIERLPVGSLP